MNRNKILGIAMIVCAAVLVAAVALSMGEGIGYRYDHAEKFTAGGGTVEGAVKNLEVDWIDGQVTIAYHSEPTVLISETSKKNISGDLQLRWWLDGDTLRVRYAKSGVLRLNWDLNKELTLTLPEGTELQNAAVCSTSGDVEIPALKADFLKLNVTSGNIRVSASANSVESRMTSGSMALNIAGQVREILASATSGDIRIETEEADRVNASVTSGLVQVKAARAADFRAGATSGSLDIDIAEAEKVKLEGTSANVRVRIGSLEVLDIGVTSGDVAAYLPAEPGFRARVSTTSGRFDYGMSLTKQGSDYICGDGSAEVSIHSTSGNVKVDRY